MTNELRRITINGVDLSTLDRGNGHPILLVHGFPLNHKMWRYQIDALSKKFRVIVPNLRGFEGSEAGDLRLTMQQFADDLNGMLDALFIDQPITFCGSSMGGYIAWEFIKKFPNRLRSLILCDTRAAADTDEGVEGRKKMAVSVLEHGAEFAAIAMQPKLFAPSTLESQPEVAAEVRQVILDAPPTSIIAALHGMAARPDSTSMLGQIKIPTLVLVGEHDAITTAQEMRGIAGAIPDAQFVEIPNAGHMAPMENPQAVNAACHAFLNA